MLMTKIVGGQDKYYRVFNGVSENVPCYASIALNLFAIGNDLETY
jgi:hypothetical protein